MDNDRVTKIAIRKNSYSNRRDPEAGEEGHGT